MGKVRRYYHFSNEASRISIHVYPKQRVSDHYAAAFAHSLQYCSISQYNLKRGKETGTTGSVMRKKQQGPKRTVRTPENVERVREAVVRSLTRSVQ